MKERSKLPSAQKMVTFVAKKAVTVEDLKKNFLSSKWQNVTDLLTKKAHLLVYLGIIKKMIRRHFWDKPIFLREQDGVLVVAIRASGLDFDARCAKTEALLRHFNENVPDEIAADIGISII
jgi:hypothetical protein